MAGGAGDMRTEKRKPRKVRVFHATIKEGITCYGRAPWLMRCVHGFFVGERVKVTVESCRKRGAKI